MSTSAQTPAFVSEAHRYFSAHGFNEAWKWMEQPKRTPEQDLDMLLCSMASFWHWNRREDVNAEKRSIACWQISRVYTLLGNGAEALRFAERCLQESEQAGVEVFYLAYAYEALARACKIMGEEERKQQYHSVALQLAEQIENLEYRTWLLADLKSI